MQRTKKQLWIWGMLSLLLLGCDPTGEEPKEVVLPISSDALGLVPAVNVEGWEVRVDVFDVCVENFEFTQEGEAHVSFLKQISDFFVPVAMAHPGHLAGGDVTGVLDGAWAIQFLPNDTLLGNGTLLEGAYRGFNMHFCTATVESGVAENAAILGHNAYISGLAIKDSESIQFEVFVDIADDPVIFGGLFEMSISPASRTQLKLRPMTRDPLEGDCFFDGIDFGALDVDGDSSVSIVSGDASHNILMKALMSHDHWSVVPEQ